MGHSRRLLRFAKMLLAPDKAIAVKVLKGIQKDLAKKAKRFPTLHEAEALESVLRMCHEHITLMSFMPPVEIKLWPQTPCGKMIIPPGVPKAYDAFVMGLLTDRDAKAACGNGALESILQVHSNYDPLHDIWNIVKNAINASNLKGASAFVSNNIMYCPKQCLQWGLPCSVQDVSCSQSLVSGEGVQGSLLR
jgi:hypothetical protein